MATLLIPLVGPLQSWGLDSRFDLRQTSTEPTKSAVIGLLCCCLGRDRTAPIDDLAAMPFGVRVDQDGSLLRDFHTAQDVISANGKKRSTLVSNRWHLSDAAMLAGLESPDLAFLKQLHQALIHPVWTPALGRRACIPTVPLSSGGVVDLPLTEALEQAPPLTTPRRPVARRMVVEATEPQGAIARPDQPIAPFAQRRFGVRFVRTYSLPPCPTSTSHS